VTAFGPLVPEAPFPSYTHLFPSILFYIFNSEAYIDRWSEIDLTPLFIDPISLRCRSFLLQVGTFDPPLGSPYTSPPFFSDNGSPFCCLLHPDRNELDFLSVD